MGDESAVVPKKVRLIDKCLIFLTKHWLPIMASGFFIVLLVLYFVTFNDGLSDDSNDWGNFGSYIGSLFSFITIIYLVVANRKEREEAREQAVLQEMRFAEQISLERNKKESEYVFDLLERHDIALDEALKAEDQRKSKSYMLSDIYSRLEQAANKIVENGLTLKSQHNDSSQLIVESESDNIRNIYSDYWIRFSKVNKIYCFSEIYLRNIVSRTSYDLLSFWHYNIDPFEIMILSILYGYEESSRDAYISNMGEEHFNKKFFNPSTKLQKYCNQ